MLSRCVLTSSCTFELLLAIWVGQGTAADHPLGAENQAHVVSIGGLAERQMSAEGARAVLGAMSEALWDLALTMAYQCHQANIKADMIPLS